MKLITLKRLLLLSLFPLALMTFSCSNPANSDSSAPNSNATRGWGSNGLPLFTFTPLAGNPYCGIRGANGLLAMINGVDGITFDAQGNVIYASSCDLGISKVTRLGVVSNITGGPGAGHQDGPLASAQFYFPTDIVTDSKGNLFVLEIYKIRKISPEGIVSTFAGDSTGGLVDGTGSAARFYYAGGLAIDSQDNLYVADTGNDVIRKVTPQAVVTTFAGSGRQGNVDGQLLACFASPGKIAVDKTSGNIYVTDSVNHNIRKISPSAYVSTLAGSGQAGFSNGTGSAARFNGPQGIAVTKNGNLYVVDTNNHCIRYITPTGWVTTIEGTGTDAVVGGSGHVALLNDSYPTSIAIDPDNNLFVGTGCQVVMGSPDRLDPHQSAISYTGNNFTELVYGSYPLFDTNLSMGGSREFSITFWFKTTSQQSNNTFFDNRTAASKGIHACLYNGMILLQLGDGTSYTNYWGGYSSQKFNDGKWHLAVFTLNLASKTGLNLYVDGIRQCQGDPTRYNGKLDNGQSLFIAKHRDGGSSNFTGSIDLLSFARHVMSENEMTTLLTRAGS